MLKSAFFRDGCRDDITAEPGRYDSRQRTDMLLYIDAVIMRGAMQLNDNHYNS